MVYYMHVYIYRRLVYKSLKHQVGEMGRGTVWARDRGRVNEEVGKREFEWDSK